MDKAMTGFLRRAALVVVAALSLGAMAVPSLAQELAPEHLALARKYIDLTDKSGVYETSLVETGVQTMRTILTQKPDLDKPLQAAIIATLETYKNRKGELLDQFARLYAARFSMEELRAIVEFYAKVKAELKAAGFDV